MSEVSQTSLAQLTPQERETLAHDIALSWRSVAAALNVEASAVEAHLPVGFVPLDAARKLISLLFDANCLSVDLCNALERFYDCFGCT